jgi:transcriptional regulator with XRE-family HTH domain
VIATESFGTLLGQYRLAASLSQEALARRAKLSVTAIAALERGRRTAPRPGTVLLLADALALDARQRRCLVDSAAQARQGQSPARSVEASGPRQRHNLPAELSPFIGRERECRQVLLMMSTTRLLMLTGAAGKSRQIAAGRPASD